MREVEGMNDLACYSYDKRRTAHFTGARLIKVNFPQDSLAPADLAAIQHLSRSLNS